MTKTKPGSITVLSGIALTAICTLYSCTGTARSSAETKDQIAEARAVLASATALMLDGKAEEALDAIDKTGAYRAELPRELRGQLQLVFGEANIAFANQVIEGGGDTSIVTSCFLDAEANLSSAATALADDPRPLVVLGRHYYKQANWSKASDAATNAIERVKVETEKRRRAAEASASKGETNTADEADELFDPLMLRAEARLWQFIAARKAERAEDASADASEATRSLAMQILADLARAQRIRSDAPKTYGLAATTHRWLGRDNDALRILEDGIRVTPDHPEHHEAIHSIYGAKQRTRELIGFYRGLKRKIQPASAYVAWYTGHAYRTHADEARKKGDRDGATARYKAAEAEFAGCAEINPNFKASCDVKRALCAVSIARMALDEGDEKVAEAELDRAFGITPQIAAISQQGYDVHFDEFKKSYRGGIYALGGRFMGAGSQRLDRAREFFQKVTKRHPTWGEAWNNLGFACRDYGVKLEEDEPAKARQLYEESYAAYTKAAAISTSDPRIQNDCGLMLLYHLKRDLDKAVAQFEKAIALGTEQLDDLGEKDDEEDDATKARRRFLEEATGDAWQNWGLYHFEREEWDKAKQKYVKSLEYYPYRAREAARRLRTIRSKIGWLPVVPVRSSSPIPERQDIALCSMPSSAYGEAIDTEALDDVAKALEHIAKGEAEAALDLVESKLDDDQKDPEVWYAAGRASLVFAQQLIARKGEGVQANLIDATTRLKKADELSHALETGSKNLGKLVHIEPNRWAIEAMLMRGMVDEAVALGTRHLTHLDSLKLEFSGADRSPLLFVIADACARQGIAAIRAKKKDDPSIDGARQRATTAIGVYEKLSTADKGKVATLASRTVQSWSNLEEWAEKPVAALRAWKRFLLAVPDKDLPNGVNSMLAVVGRAGEAKTAIGTIDDLITKKRGDAATMVWYRGYARVLDGNSHVMGGEADAAPAVYDGAIADFEKAIKLNSGFTANAKFWIATAMQAKGWCAFHKKKHDDAKKLWLDAAKTSPSAAERVDALGNSAKRGVLKLGEEHFNAGQFRQGAELMEEYLKAVGKADGDILNNAGFLYREAATRTRGDGRQELFRRSWSAYLRATVATPNNVRVLNDCALIDAYYLRENKKKAEELLQRAIELGQIQLEENPPQGDRAKRDLEEALGDAYMNLGYMLIEDEKRWDEAKKLLEKSLAYYPKRARASTRHLQRLERLRRDKKGDK